MDLSGAVGMVIDRLTDAGIRAVADERDVNPPCVLVRAPRMAFRFGARCYDAEWTLWVIVPDSGRTVALDNLGPLIDATAAALGGPIIAATPVSVPGVDGSPPLPAYELTFTTTLKESAP